MAWFEDEVNAISDTDWTWWPFLSWRPAKNAKMGLKFCAAFLVLGVLVGVVLLLSLLGLAVLRLYSHVNSLPRVVPSGAVPTQTAVRHLVSSLTKQYGLLVCGGMTAWFAVCLVPIVRSWNRRASRLTKEAAQPPELFTQHPNIWPPSPKRPTL